MWIMKRSVCLWAIVLVCWCGSAAFGAYCEFGWTTDSARFLGGRYRAGAGFYEGKIYLWGGGYVIEDPDPYRYYSDMQVYDPAIDEWTTLSPMPEEKSNFGFAILDGYAYAVAGYWTGGGLTQYLDSCARYDIDADEWETIADYPDTLAGLMCGAGGDGKLYCFGGWDGATDKADAYVYNPNLNLWLPIADLPRWKDYGYADSDGTYVYITGGWEETGADSNTYAYDPSTNSYQTLSSPIGRQSPILSAAGGMLWLAGGSDHTDVPLHVYNQVYDGTDWVLTGETMTFDRVAAAAAYAPGYGIYVLGGWDDEIQETRDVQLWTICVPELTQIDPLTGPPETTVTITGGQFESELEVFLSDDKAVYEMDDVTVIDLASLTAVVPDDVPAGTYDLLVVGTFGQTDTLLQAFTVIPETDDDDDDDNDTADDDDNDNDNDTADDDDDDNDNDSVDDDASPNGDDDDAADDDDDASSTADDDDDDNGCGC